MDNFIFSKLFWGVVVLLIGISFISQAIFKINLPVGKIVFALVLIYVGVKMLFGAFGKGQDHSNFMGESNIKIENLDDAKYDVVFGSQVIDLSRAFDNGEITNIECNVVFGSAKIILPKGIKTNIKSSSVFGSVRTPGNETTFGSSDFSTTGVSNCIINLKVNAVFGSAKVFEN
ncbi:MAG: LiaF domain-containing protein [Bacteroidia bacterium]